MKHRPVGATRKEVVEDAAGMRRDREPRQLPGREVAKCLALVYLDELLRDICVVVVDVLDLDGWVGELVPAIDAIEAEPLEQVAGLFFELAEGGRVGCFVAANVAASKRPHPGEPGRRQVVVAELEEQTAPAIERDHGHPLAPWRRRLEEPAVAVACQEALKHLPRERVHRQTGDLFRRNEAEGQALAYLDRRFIHLLSAEEDVEPVDAVLALAVERAEAPDMGEPDGGLFLEFP